MKTLLLYLVVFLSVGKLYSQYGNEWINYTQPYYKIKIAKQAIYRIDSTTIANSGISLSSINPQNFQVFYKGQEQYIYVHGESDGVFNSSDYIEFYADKNDGRTDSLLFNNITYLTNPYVGLFNDTIHAFLTWNTSTTNKRVSAENDINFSSYTPASYFYTEKVTTSNASYNEGEEYAKDIFDPRYARVEGYGSGLGIGNSDVVSFNPYLYTTQSLPIYFSAVFSGNTKYAPVGGQNVIYDHRVKLGYKDNNNNMTYVLDTLFYGRKSFKQSYAIDNSNFNLSSYFILDNVSHSSFYNSSNSTISHYLYTKFPQTLNLGNNSSYVLFVDDDNTQAKTYLNLSGVNFNTDVVFYDLTNHKRILTGANATNVDVIIPNSGGEKQCFLSGDNAIVNVTTLKSVNQAGYFINYKQPNLDSAFVIVTHSSLQSSATQYKQYRESVQGGSHKVILAYVEDLYDQFAYGNEKNPLAIRHFCKYLVDSLSSSPKYLFLLGKGVQHSQLRTNTASWNMSLVPTIGRPVADNLFTSGFKNTSTAVPYLLTGRIAAKNDNEAIAYLNKIIQHEALQPAEWRKKVLHFAGGTDLGQQNTLQGYLSNYETIITDTSFGGIVFNFKKTTTAPIQVSISDSVKQLINSGSGLITFFGHGSYTGFDQAIDDPANYSNAGKYPLMIANSCLSGNIHTSDVVSASENFTLIDQKGTIGFIASTSKSLDNNLNNYTTELYKSIGQKHYGESIGTSVKYACEKSDLFFSTLQSITALDMTLHGDPALKLNNYRFPDYEITNSSVFFDTKKYIDSIGVNVIVRNLGKAIHDTFVVRVERYFPNGDSITYFKTIKAPLYKDTLSFFVDVEYSRAVGLNHFKVKVDAFNVVQEISEINNTTTGTVDLLIQGGDVVPIYPYKYAVVPNTPQITLKASTADPFITNKNYRIQLDTNDTFLNPIATTLLPSIGGVIEWTVNLPFGDSTVYFWRITKDSISPTESYSWRESSFQVIGTKTGWAQAHFHQFKNDAYQYVTYKKALRRFDFENDLKIIKCQDGFVGSALQFSDVTYSINNATQHVYFCGPNGWTFAVFDPISGKPWRTDALNPSTGLGTYGNCHCDVNRPLYAFDFGASNFCGFPNWETTMTNFINIIPNGHYVLAYSADNHNSSTFSNSEYTAFESFGSGNIRTVKDTTSIIVFGKKGMLPGQANEVIGLNKKSVINLEDTLQSSWDRGYIASELIGPSVKWRSLHWRQTSLESLNKDSVFLKVVGIKSNGLRDTLVTFPKDSIDVLDLYNYVDAAIYPQMQLIAYIKDSVYNTSAQLKRWQVLYDEVPECALNPKKGFTMLQDTVQEGDDFVVRVPIENIGTLPFNDSLVINYWIEDVNRINHPLPQKTKKPPFNPSAILVDTITFNTHQYPGTNALWIDVNNPTNAKYQTEQYHFNNIARIPFTVNVDKINPILDVTFDGVHIMNNDIVSAKPYVLITVKDENKFLALNDTSNFFCYLKKPDDVAEQRLFFANNIQFTPAQLPNNSCKLEYTPQFNQDGIYTLIVSATDRSSNNSGSIDYKIQFEVITKSTITQVVNYPNPFSTSTRFVFTLTGSEIPDVFNIQILTVSGKVVKTITKDELGPLRIGKNITQYAWNGTDEFGDKLANGVYLYKISTRINGSTIEKKSTDVDQFFTKEFGKMVIIR